MDFNPKILKQKCLCLPIAIWKKVLLLLEILNLSLMIESILTPRWVMQGYKKTLWKGGLLICGGCSGEWYNLYYHQISIIAENNKVTGYYKNFQSLAVSGIVYCVLESVVSFLFVLHILLQTCDWNYLKFQIFLPFVGFLLHSFGVILWFTINDATFFGDCFLCSDYDNSRQFCATQGPVLAIITEIGIGLIVFGSFLVRKHETQQFFKIRSLDESESPSEIKRIK